MDARVEPGHDEWDDLCRPRQRAVDHGDSIRYAIDGDEGAEPGALLLAEQDLVEHVEPVERDAGTAVLALLDGIENGSRRPISYTTFWMSSAEAPASMLASASRRSCSATRSLSLGSRNFLVGATKSR
jgi:hypothetical protein